MNKAICLETVVVYLLYKDSRFDYIDNVLGFISSDGIPSMSETEKGRKGGEEFRE